MIKVNEVSVEGNPDCVTVYEDGYVVSTYTLNKETGEKKGSLLYFEDHQIKAEVLVDKGILDTKVIDNKLVSCCSDGGLLVTDKDRILSNTQLTESCCSYLDFNSSSIFCPSLDGTLHIIDRCTLNLTSLPLNPYEIWYTACTETLLFIPISIGKLQVKDLRTMETVSLITLHESEISSIIPQEHQVFCGSFDGHISTTDLRINRKVCTSDIGGGVWRIKLYQNKFLTANMEEGFKYTSNSELISLIPTESLAYGLGQVSDSLFIGCSFYDSKLFHLCFPLVSNH